MSLLRQLWIVAVVACALAFAGSFAISLITARSYLQQQLLAQANDGAAALALSMSQQAQDDATAELMVSALFDSGHFERIRYEDERGRKVVERVANDPAGGVPTWFTDLLHLDPQPGTALVNHGWNQAGKVTLVPYTRFAYEALWKGAIQLSIVMVGLALILGLSLSVLVRWLRGPLNEMVAQAEAIGERRFVTMREPKVRELRSAVRALNLMVDRVRVMFGEQASRIEDLRTEANRDPLTALPNRGFFLGRLRNELQDEDAAPAGALALVRIAGLADLNRRLGRERTDALLRSAAEVLREVAAGEADYFVARLNGADFAWLMPGADPETARRLSVSAARALEALHRHGHADQSPVGFVGVALFHRGDELGHVMARADAALMRAERGEDAEPVISAYDTPLVARTQDEWRTLLQSALQARDFALAGFPVAHVDGRLWHEEAMMRMRAPDDGAPWTAGQFMPAADRLGMTAALDLLAVELALQRLHHTHDPIAVNLSPISLTNLQFREGLQRLLAASPAMARRLWVEVSERGLDQGLSGLAAVAPILSQHGCKLGIEHFGRHFSAIPRLYAQRVDYLKVDGSFVAGIEENAGNQRLIKAIVDVARGLDIQVLAERVSTPAEWQTLTELGVAGVTGPAVTERLRQS